MKKRILLAGLLTAASLGVAAPPAQAACEGVVDVACSRGCVPDNPCTITVCVLWVQTKCVIGNY